MNVKMKGSCKSGEQEPCQKDIQAQISAFKVNNHKEQDLAICKEMAWDSLFIGKKSVTYEINVLHAGCCHCNP